MTFADVQWGLAFAGLGLFLFGIKLMGDGLKSYAGDKLRDYIDKYTSNPLSGVFIGAVMTAIVQSSSATTVITISFVRAGLMTLEQAMGIIIGANIGTTFTVFLIGLDFGQFSVYLILIGALFLHFTQQKKSQDLGHIIIGFGLIFFGITEMSNSLSLLGQVPQIKAFAELCSKNPFIGLLGGAILTAIMQSSSGALGVMQIIYETGVIPFNAIVPFLYGSNIGTCVTALLASLDGNTPSKRASFLHLLFNLMGATLGMIFLQPLSQFVFWLTKLGNIGPKTQISVVHILFNVITAILIIPFINPICKMVRKIIRGEEPKKITINIDDLNVEKFPVPAAALPVAYHSLEELRNLVLENVNKAQAYLMNEKGKKDELEEIQQNEILINKIVHVLTTFLTSMPAELMSVESSRAYDLYLEITNNLERIGDLAVNIGEFAKMVHDDRGRFSASARGELDEMFLCLHAMYERCFSYLETRELRLYSQVMVKEAELDSLEYNSRKNHFKRLANKTCTSSIAGSIYADILANIERMGDHCCNICRSSFEVYGEH